MEDLNVVSGAVIGSAVGIHQRLGPGLFESVYEELLASALGRAGLLVERQKRVDFTFDGIVFQRGLRVDLLVEGRVVVELKSVEHTAPVHARQVLTYLRLMDLRVGLLLNFGAPTMRQGITRIVNHYVPSASLR